jgi:teichuronic acid biosynthesis glycosyltransferase TuaC
MKVLFVTNTYPCSENPGLTPCIKEQKESLEKEGISVDIIHIRGRNPILKYFGGAWSVFAETITKSYDIVHAHYGFSGVSARFEFRAPLVVTLRGSDVYHQAVRTISRIGLTFGSKIIVMSDEMKMIIGRQDAIVLPYGINCSLFKPIPMEKARRKLNYSPEENLILFPYDPRRKEKGFKVLRKAVLKLEKDSGQRVKIVNIYNEVHDLMPIYMNACDIMVLPSEYEGSPIAVLEAMACNLPIVSFKVGDVTKRIEDVQYCYMSERNVDDLAEKIGLAVFAKQRTNGRSLVLNLDSREVAKKLINIYKRIIGNGL